MYYRSHIPEMSPVRLFDEKDSIYLSSHSSNLEDHMRVWSGSRRCARTRLSLAHPPISQLRPLSGVGGSAFA